MEARERGVYSGIRLRSHRRFVSDVAPSVSLLVRGNNPLFSLRFLAGGGRGYRVGEGVALFQCFCW